MGDEVHMRQPELNRLGLGFGVLLGSVVGGATVLFLQTGKLSFTANLSYSDLAATLLAAVGVIVAIFGGVLALAAFWGFNQVKRDAVAAAAEAGARTLKEQIENGPLRTYIVEQIEAIIAARIDSDEMEARIQKRVDQVIFGNPKDEELDGDEEGNEQ